MLRLIIFFPTINAGGLATTTTLLFIISKYQFIDVWIDEWNNILIGRKPDDIVILYSEYQSDTDIKTNFVHKVKDAINEYSIDDDAMTDIIMSAIDFSKVIQNG